MQFFAKSMYSFFECTFSMNCLKISQTHREAGYSSITAGTQQINVSSYYYYHYMIHWYKRQHLLGFWESVVKHLDWWQLGWQFWWRMWLLNPLGAEISLYFFFCFVIFKNITLFKWPLTGYQSHKAIQANEI